MCDTHDAEVLLFAREELHRCLKSIDPTAEPSAELRVDSAAFPSLSDPVLDDAFSVTWHGNAGSITGSNPRSVLLGVYALVRELGGRFIRPGRMGEILPRRPLAQVSVEFTRVADHRYRGVCIEGAVSEQHVRDMIDWLPKMGFNLYFIQFREAHVFFEEWYTHIYNEFLEGDPTYSVEQSRAIVDRLAPEMCRRGLQFHACGHGWLCESIGYSSTGWHRMEDKDIPAHIRPLLAQVKGERKFFGDIPVNTQLCYSSPEVQRRVVEEIVSYALAHPEKDVLHIWLADNFNNMCECDACRRLRPADYYVQMLNEVDRRLTAAGSPARISFILYYDLLWTPIQEKLHNPDRFIMLFAPITRNYRMPFVAEGETPPTAAERMSVQEEDILPYRRNDLLLPPTPEDNLKFLYRWQQHFPHDCLIFDYHMMWDLHKNYAQLELSRVQFRDVELLQTLGLNGYISCQLTRSGFPSGLCNYLLGTKLFDRSADYETVAGEYFRAAYGENWQQAWDFLQLLNDSFSWPYSRGELPVADPAVAALLRETPRKLTDYQPILREGEAKAAHPEQKQMWLYLQDAAEIYAELALVLYGKASGQPLTEVRTRYDLFRQNLCRREWRLQDIFDLCSFHLIVSTIIDKEDGKAIGFDQKAN